MTNMDTMNSNLIDQELEFSELSDSEINDVSGGFLPIVIGVVWAATQIGLAVAQREICAQ